MTIAVLDLQRTSKGYAGRAHGSVGCGKDVFSNRLGRFNPPRRPRLACAHLSPRPAEIEVYDGDAPPGGISCQRQVWPNN